MKLIEELKVLAKKEVLGKLLRSSSSEREFCKLLASHLPASACVIVNGVEADLLREGEAIEVKLYPSRFYEGFDQALALKHVAGLERVAVLHVVKAIADDYLQSMRKLCAAVGVPALVFSEVSGLHVVEC
ncbi:MAG: hypothetical protein QXT33_02240 [Thermofilum sp.]